MEDSDPQIHRSGRFILSFQLQAMTNSLQIILQSRQTVGESTVEAVKKLRVDFMRIASGPCTENFPEVREDSGGTDLFALASLMNGTLDSFGTPEETEEKKRFFCYERLDLAVGPFKLGLGQPSR